MSVRVPVKVQAPLHRTVILANGRFPAHELPLAALRSARRVICCDGAADKLLASGREPDWIVGDLDSLGETTARHYRERLVRVAQQESNDLDKAFHFALERKWYDLVILGATGLREDHTLANLSLLVDFAVRLAAERSRERLEMARLSRLGQTRRQHTMRIALLSDSGLFTPLLSSAQFRSHPGQAVSLFSFEPHLKLYAEGLKYPLERVTFTRWWQAALNEATGSDFKLLFLGGPLLVFQAYPSCKPG